jgi:AmmeMemoRadiSam system protein B
MAPHALIPAIGPAVAGSWYPSGRAALSDLVDRMLDEVRAPAAVTRMVVAPHAGFEYSGRVAAHAFRPFAGSGTIRRVILIGPSHYVGFGGARLPHAQVYRTPLGDVALDRSALDDLATRPGFEADNALWAREHSLEAELPFLQRTLGESFEAVPVLVGAHTTAPQVRLIADGLRAWAGPATLVVVSSDFTHFGRAFGYLPFEADVPENVRRLDRGAIDLIAAGDAEGFARYCRETGATICGRLAIEVALRLPPAGAAGHLFAYDTSGRMTGDWEHTVSYAALGLDEAAG